MHLKTTEVRITVNKQNSKFQVQIIRNCMTLSCTLPCCMSFSSGCRLAADSEVALGLSLANPDSVQAKDSSLV